MKTLWFIFTYPCNNPVPRGDLNVRKTKAVSVRLRRLLQWALLSLGVIKLCIYRNHSCELQLEGGTIKFCIYTEPPLNFQLEGFPCVKPMSLQEDHARIILISRLVEHSPTSEVESASCLHVYLSGPSPHHRIWSHGHLASALLWFLQDLFPLLSFRELKRGC